MAFGARQISFLCSLSQAADETNKLLNFVFRRNTNRFSNQITGFRPRTPTWQFKIQMVRIGFWNFFQWRLKFLLEQIVCKHRKVRMLPKHFAQMGFETPHIVFDFKRQRKNLLMHFFSFQMHIQSHLSHVGIVLFWNPCAFARNLFNLVQYLAVLSSQAHHGIEDLTDLLMQAF